VAFKRVGESITEGWNSFKGILKSPAGWGGADERWFAGELRLFHGSELAAKDARDP
jgi:hypothetical protein